MLASLSIGLLTAGAPTFGEVRYRIASTGSLGLPLDINTIHAITDAGHLAGTSTDLDLASYGFVIQPDTTIDLIDLPGEPYFWGAAVAINESGHATGHYELLDSSEGYVWGRESGLTLLGSLPGGSGSARPTGISGLDVICGSASSANGPRAFRWSFDDGIEGLGVLSGDNRSEAHGINDAGWIVGRSGTGLFEGRAFVWTRAGGMTPVAGTAEVLPECAYAINESGLVVGRAMTPDGRRAFAWSEDGGLVVLPAPAGYSSYAIAYAVNDQGVVVGTSAREVGPSRYEVRPFIWDRTRGTRTLDTLIDPCVPTAPYMNSAIAINNHGWISISSLDMGGYLLTPYYPGDSNSDDMVELADLATLLIHFGETSGSAFEDGDTDCDGDVDLEDLSELLNDFGATLP